MRPRNLPHTLENDGEWDGHCLIWKWGRTYSISGAYGCMKVNGKVIRAHRYYYEKHNGPIPEYAVIDHTCGNKLCINPFHLEAVTLSTNTKRWHETK